MHENKMNHISTVLNRPFDDLINELYVKRQMTTAQISKLFYSQTKILITPRSIQRQLKKLNLIRTYSEAFNLAIKTGRKSYDKLRKSIKSSELRRGINLKTRYVVLARDGFKCVICGRTGKDDKLVVDHINPVTRGGKNGMSNLRTLCRACNHGKMLFNEKI
jgi:hypothetical protein